MKLRAIRVCDVRGFLAPGKAVESISDGLNVLAAENEFGKSTMFDALRIVLFDKYTSAPTQVKSLRPYQTTDGPTIEVDLETDAGLFRLRKRFLSRKMASVIDLGTGKTLATGAAVQDWIVGVIGGDKPNDGPTGLLWVEQNKSLVPPSATGKSSAILNSLLEGAVSDVTGGAKLRAVLETAKAACSKLVTDKHKRPTGRYAEALKTRDEANHQVATLTARLKDLDAKRTELTALQQRLAQEDATEASADRQVKLKQLTEQIVATQQAHQRLEGLENEVRLSERAVANKKQERETRQRQQATLRQNMEQANTLQRTLAGLEEKKSSLSAEVQAARAEEEKQKKAVAAAGDVMMAVRNADKVRILRAQLEACDQQIAAAEACHTRLSDAVARRDSCRLDRQHLEDLEALQRAKDDAETALRMSVLHVSVRYLPDSEHKVRKDGKAMRSDEPLSVTGRVELDLDGIGQLIVEPAATAEFSNLEADARDAGAALSSALARLDVTSLGEARTAFEQKTHAAVVAETAQSELDRLAPDGIARLNADRAKIADQLSAIAGEAAGDGPDMDEVSAEAKHQEASQGLTAAITRRQAVECSLSEVAQKESECRVRLQTLTRLNDEARATLGDETGWADRIASLDSDLDRATKGLVSATTARTELKAEIRDPTALQDEKKRLEAAQVKAQQERLSLTQKKDVLVGQLTERDGEGVGEQLGAAKGALQRAQAQVNIFAAEHRALETLIESLETAESHSQQQFYKPVMQELQPLLARVLPDAEVRLSKNFSPDEVVRGGIAEAYGGLSGGTREQIAVLTRLAFARLMAGKGREMPVILDDALVYSDDKRIARMFAALKDAASDIQMIVLSCRQKTFQDLGGTPLQLRDWRPD